MTKIEDLRLSHKSATIIEFVRKSKEKSKNLERARPLYQIRDSATEMIVRRTERETGLPNETALLTFRDITSGVNPRGRIMHTGRPLSPRKVQ